MALAHLLYGHGAAGRGDPQLVAWRRILRLGQQRDLCRARRAKATSGKLVTIRPYRLEAVDFSGKELWARSIRETAYLGPYPGREPRLPPGNPQ